MKPDRYLLAAAALILVLALGATAWILAVKLGERETMAGPGLVVMTSGVGGPFALTDQQGRAVTEADFAGSPALVYFGYSFCPDICPTTLQTMAAALDSEAARARGVRGVFITVDPERDTVEQLAAYVPLFQADLVGLTGAEDAIEEAAKGFRAYYQPRKDIDPESYPVDHSSFVYLMDRSWRLVGVFRPDATAEDMAAALDRLSQAADLRHGRHRPIHRLLRRSEVAREQQQGEAAQDHHADSGDRSDQHPIQGVPCCRLGRGRVVHTSSHACPQKIIDWLRRCQAFLPASCQGRADGHDVSPGRAA